MPSDPRDNPKVEYAYSIVGQEPDFIHFDEVEEKEKIMERDENNKFYGVDIIRTLLSKIVDVSEFNKNRMSCLILRLSGLSYQEIGIKLGISKQAVRKHIMNIAQLDSALGGLLKQTSVLNITGSNDYNKEMVTMECKVRNLSSNTRYSTDLDDIHLGMLEKDLIRLKNFKTTHNDSINARIKTIEEDIKTINNNKKGEV